MKKYLILAVTLVLLAGFTQAVKVGVYPGVNDLGTVERGQTVSGQIVLINPDGGEVSLSLQHPNPSFYTVRPESYDFVPENASQEDVTDWFSLESREVQLRETRLFQVDGRSVEGNGAVSYILNVPGNAEPGYHRVQVLPDLEKSSGNTIGTQGISVHNIVFQVPGRAVRDGEILGFYGQRKTAQTEVVKTVVQNTGSVTATFRVNTRVLLENRSVDLGGTGKTLSPGEIGVFRRSWDLDGRESGRYNVSSDVSWSTGDTMETGSISVSSEPEPSLTGSLNPSNSSKTDLETYLIFFNILVLLGLLTGLLIRFSGFSFREKLYM